MMNKALAQSVPLLMALSLLFVLSGCSSNNDDGQDSSTVQGNVAQVVTAMQDEAPAPVQTAHWMDFLSFVRTAHAQGTDLSGITIEAQINGATIDTTESDAEGNFTLDVSAGGEVTLVFTTDTYTVTLIITVPGGSDVSLVVSLQPEDTEEPVVVEEIGVAHHPIKCSSDTVTLSNAEEDANGDANQEANEETDEAKHEDYVIKGDGGTCIRATGTACRPAPRRTATGRARRRRASGISPPPRRAARCTARCAPRPA